MTHRFQSALFAASLFLAIGSSGMVARASGPIEVVGQGENFAVTYPPGHDENALGGGRVAVTGNGESLGIRYLDPTAAHPVPGVPVPTGGEAGGVAYIPANHHYGSRTVELMNSPHVRHHM